MILFIIAVLFFIAALLVLITIYLSYAAVKTSPAYELKKASQKPCTGCTRAVFLSDLRIEILQEMSPIDKILYKFKHYQKTS